MAKGTRTEMATGQTIGIDVGDSWSQICVVDVSAAVVEEAPVRTTTRAVHCRCATLPRSRVALEVGTHSPWLRRLLAKLGHEAIVANPGRVRLIAASDRKHDCADAERLARLGRIDPAVLTPLLAPHLTVIADRSAQIAQAERAIVRFGREAYPETQLLQRVAGVGPLTALTFILTIDAPHRFAFSRMVGGLPRARPAAARLGPTPAPAAHHEGRRSAAPAPGTEAMLNRIASSGDEVTPEALVEQCLELAGPVHLGE